MNNDPELQPSLGSGCDPELGEPLKWSHYIATELLLFPSNTICGVNICAERTNRTVLDHFEHAESFKTFWNYWGLFGTI